jgi:hypothetical protein
VASSARNECLGLLFLSLLDKFNSPYVSRLGHHSWSKFRQNKIRNLSTILFVKTLLTFSTTLSLPLSFAETFIHPLELVVIAGDRPVVFVNLTDHQGSSFIYEARKSVQKYHSSCRKIF